MNETELIDELKELVFDYCSGLNYNKIILRFTRDEMSCSLLSAIFLDEKYMMLDDVVGMMGKELDDYLKLSRSLKRKYSSVFSSKNIVYLFEGNNVSIIENEIFSIEDDFRDRLLWSYKYLGLEDELLTDEDRKIGQQLL